MMKYLTMLILLGTACLSGFAQMPGMDMLEVGAIKRITLGQEASNVVVRVALTFINKTEFELKMRDGNFRVVAIPPSGEKTVIGTTQIADLPVPNMASGQGPAEAELVLNLGSDPNEISQKLTTLMLTVVDTKEKIRAVLEGTCDIGMKSGTTWQYLTNIEIEYELNPEKVNWNLLWEKAARAGVTITFGEEQPAE